MLHLMSYACIPSCSCTVRFIGEIMFVVSSPLTKPQVTLNVSFLSVLESRKVLMVMSVALNVSWWFR